MRLIDADALFLPNESSDSVLVIGSVGGKTLALAYRLMERKVNAAPTIEAEPVKHGRWVVKNGRIVCDQCGALWSICPERKQQEEHLKHVYETEKFCYTCGAKMDLEDDNG